jgi:hypothetical protein
LVHERSSFFCPTCQPKGKRRSTRRLLTSRARVP